MLGPLQERVRRVIGTGGAGSKYNTYQSFVTPEQLQPSHLVFPFHPRPDAS